MALTEPPVARTQMLIHQPVRRVFEAFVDPEITRRFWFTKSSGRVEEGAALRWDWEMYGVSTRVNVKEVTQDSKILIEWDDPATSVEWRFTSYGDATFVTISAWGFHGNEDAVVAQAIDSMGGFSFLLAGAKALLEHDIELSLVADHQPPPDPVLP